MAMTTPGDDDDDDHDDDDEDDDDDDDVYDAHDRVDDDQRLRNYVKCVWCF